MSKNLRHTRNPDMIAFTIGWVVLQLIHDDLPTDFKTIKGRLRQIAAGRAEGRVTPEMAKDALSGTEGLERGRMRDVA
ncbi:hypothetical protein [Paracoccus versutus]|nr:hypothetical protein SAMN04244548_02729 [Paracoccus pantotrophus]